MHNVYSRPAASRPIDSASTQYYVENLMRFVDALRQAGLKPGLSEAQDAIRLLEEIGFASRNSVKSALRALFAKSNEEQQRFSRVFDGFFIGLHAQEQFSKEFAQAEITKKTLLRQSADELQFQGERLDLPETLIEVYANMPESEKDRLLDFLEQTSHGINVGPKFKSVTQNIVKGRLQREAASLAGAQGAGLGLSSDNGLLYKSISAISQEEVPQALRLIRLLVRRINSHISRQYKRSARRGQLDMKATIHKSLSTGGEPYKLKFRRRRKRKQRMIILCDVSASMMLFSGFGLQFIHGMNMAADKSDVYIFSEGMERIAPDDMKSLDAFERRVTSSALWGRGTNIASALTQLRDQRDNSIQGAVLLIFSDAKTLQVQRTGALLEELRRRCKKILWMNPLPEDNWDVLPWITSYRKQANMLDCSTLERLGQACAQSARL